MAEGAVLTSISDMIDLALGTPEVGVVDFNMLQTVLHCLAQQLCVRDKNVEMRGSLTNLQTGKENQQTIAITEYLVDTDNNAKKAEAPPSASKPDTILVVKRIKKAVSSGPREIPTATAAEPTTASQTLHPPATQKPHPPAAHSSTERLSLVTISKFNLLESTVEDLKNRVYGSMPKNEEILEEVRSQTNLKAITDMWTSLNVSSRLEAAEAGISKLSSLVQDLISDTVGLQDSLSRRASKTSQAAHASAAAAPSMVAPAAPAQSVQLPAASPSEFGGPPSATKEELNAIQMVMARIRDDLDQLTQTFYATMKDLKPNFEPPKILPPPSMPAMPVVSEMLPPPDRRQSKRTFQMTSELVERINEMDRRLRECCEKVGKSDGTNQDLLHSFQDQLDYLVKQVANLNQELLVSSKLSPDLIKDLQGLMQLFQTVQDMQEQLKKVHETALQLAAEKEDRQHNINALLEQIELLKTIKLDREDMVEAMAEKADLRMLARKVSHDQFEMACDDLSRGLEHALGKLNIQEELWQQALDDIQREIETKLDKMELTPVREFFNNKLKQLQENLKQMASLRREAEAAGTKRRLLRDVNCISCDANAVMPMEAASTLPVSKPLPASYSMKPYLSYELDVIRKTQASNLPQRNMHDWENIDKQMSQSRQPQKVRSDTDKHLCNRYCGGSHTITTPAQRVARLGHFIKQWGPEVLPLSSGFATGDDGRMYRVSTGEETKVGSGGAVDSTCTPKSPTRKSDVPKPAQKPITISAECRCLESADKSGQ